RRGARPLRRRARLPVSRLDAGRADVGPPRGARGQRGGVMDAARLVALLRPELERCHARWALAGGMAVSLFGSSRMTYDMDLVVDGQAHGEVRPAAARLGFEVLYDSSACTNLTHQDP